MLRCFCLFLGCWRLFSGFWHEMDVRSLHVSVYNWISSLSCLMFGCSFTVVVMLNVYICMFCSC
jgi:hypothetical protein